MDRVTAAEFFETIGGDIVDANQNTTEIDSNELDDPPIGKATDTHGNEKSTLIKKSMKLLKSHAN
ncbi:17063_t:CDS:2, partial [Dentiscutata heterogama]